MKKTSISFIDKNNIKFNINIKLTNRNGYPELSFTGKGNGSAGQCNGSISPSTDDQKKTS